MQGKPLTQVETDFVYNEKSKGSIEKLVLLEDEDPYAIRKLFYCTSNGLRFEVVSNAKAV